MCLRIKKYTIPYDANNNETGKVEVAGRMGLARSATVCFALLPDRLF